MIVLAHGTSFLPMLWRWLEKNLKKSPRSENQLICDIELQPKIDPSPETTHTYMVWVGLSYGTKIIYMGDGTSPHQANIIGLKTDFIGSNKAAENN